MKMKISNDEVIIDILERALFEDIGDMDITTESMVPEDLPGIGKLIAKEDGVIAGLEVAELIFNILDDSLNFHSSVSDGAEVKSGQLIAVVAGSINSILCAERVALNFLQRMSGIATTTSKCVKEIVGTRAKIFDTRKTIPGLRIFDKMAVKIGGGENHRFGLSDMFLIKENHIAAAGGISQAINLCRSFKEEEELDCKIEIEVQNLDELSEVMKTGKIDIILVDNFPIEDIMKAVEIVKHKFEVEASGGITLNNLRRIAETGVDRISMGMLTHSVKALDISLIIEK
jgi:nicotinate-nucleotide pyrophosphorylase (carboxylating)